MIKSNEIQEKKILELLYSRAPNSLSYDLIVEYSPLSKEDTDKTLVNLVEKGILVTDFRKTNRDKIAQKIAERRKSYYIKNFPEDFPVKEHIKVGDILIPRLIDGDRARAEDINSIVEAMVDYTNGIDKEIDRRIRKETEKIYRQMISIFGVFVSIFAIIVISTDKMLRFSPEVLGQNWNVLLFKSTVLFIPIGVVIALLVFVVMYGGRKK